MNDGMGNSVVLGNQAHLGIEPHLSSSGGVALREVRVVGVEEEVAVEGGAVALVRLESVQQSQIGSQFLFQHLCKLQIEMQIGAQKRRTVIPHLNISKLKIKIQIEMKWYRVSK